MFGPPSHAFNGISSAIIVYIQYIELEKTYKITKYINFYLGLHQLLLNLLLQPGN